MALSDSVDLEAYISDTDGFSGADLQALMYNAHLEVVHASISATTAETSSENFSKGKGKGKAKADDSVQNGSAPKRNHRQIIPLQLDEPVSVSERAAFSARVSFDIASHWKGEIDECYM